MLFYSASNSYSPNLTGRQGKPIYLNYLKENMLKVNVVSANYFDNLNVNRKLHYLTECGLSS